MPKAGEKWNTLEITVTGRDITVRYKQSALGVGWAVLQPLVLMVIFTLVFGRFAKMPSDGVPYPLFVLSALLPWQYFSRSLTIGLCECPETTTAKPAAPGSRSFTSWRT